MRHTRQIDFGALLREEKEVLACVHSSKSLLEREAAQHRMDTLLQSGKLSRYDDGEGWYDAVPSCWPKLGFADHLPSWEQLAALHG